MGRRKIEIKPIRDDRNRSVTFLKRKGGLFKKAHELSVLCSVDVAVIIFGHNQNKKLYEYSSSDINEIIGRFNYYGGAHEHKGPADFADKRGGDDDDDDDEGGDEVDERGTPQPDYGRMNPQMQNHPGFQHVRQGTPSGSPPMHNGSTMPPFQRGPSPLPPGMSRPSSRTAQHPQHPQHMRRSSGNMHAPPPGPPSQGNFAFTPNPPFYNPQAAAPAPMQRPPPPPPPPPPVSHPATYAPHYATPPAPHHPVQSAAYMQDPRRSMGPGPPYPPPPPNMNSHAPHEHLQPPPAPQPHGSPRPQQQPHQQHQQQQHQPPPPQSQPPQQSRPTPSPQPPQQHFASPPVPQPKPLPATAKSSIFTPIDDSRSLLAQHWGSTATTHADATSRPVRATKGEPESTGGPRAHSIDVAAMQREKEGARSNRTTATPSPPTRPSAVRTPQLAQRTASTPTLGPPSRSNTNPSEPKRPRLTVQIPSEQSGDEGGGSAPDSTSQAGNTGHPHGQPSHGVVLPPPSPSAGALLSAGAGGPPNPFARPPPPQPSHTARDANGHHIENPLSALPSRFMSDSLLPSPSTFYPDWNNNMLPSPINFTTPIVPNGAGWRDEDRKRGGDDLENSEAKKAKT